jgi:hypothetical protein
LNSPATNEHSHSLANANCVPRPDRAAGQMLAASLGFARRDKIPALEPGVRMNRREFFVATGSVVALPLRHTHKNNSQSDSSAMRPMTRCAGLVRGLSRGSEGKWVYSRRECHDRGSALSATAIAQVAMISLISLIWPTSLVWPEVRVRFVAPQPPAQVAGRKRGC